MPTYWPKIAPFVMLAASNLFMTTAWYGGVRPDRLRGGTRVPGEIARVRREPKATLTRIDGVG